MPTDLGQGGRPLSCWREEMGVGLSPVGLGNEDPWACGENKTNSGETDPEGQRPWSGAHSPQDISPPNPLGSIWKSEEEPQGPTYDLQPTIILHSVLGYRGLCSQVLFTPPC